MASWCSISTLRIPRQDQYPLRLVRDQMRFTYDRDVAAWQVFALLCRAAVGHIGQEIAVDASEVEQAYFPWLPRHRRRLCGQLFSALAGTQAALLLRLRRAAEIRNRMQIHHTRLVVLSPAWFDRCSPALIAATTARCANTLMLPPCVGRCSTSTITSPLARNMRLIAVSDR